MLRSAAESQVIKLSVKLFPKNSNACDHSPPTLYNTDGQRDGQTDRQTDNLP